MKKVLVGLIAGAIMLPVGMLIGQLFQAVAPSIKIEYENTQLFRPWSDPIMSIMFVHPFIVGIILAWIWDITKGVVKGNVPMEKGLYFGFVYWVVTIPGMIISYSSFPVSPILIISWSASILAQSLCSGILFSKMLK